MLNLTFPADGIIAWLMEGDPAIRWQTMRDLSDLPVGVWEAERNQVARTGWGAQFLDSISQDGYWPAGRWTGTCWTLLTLIDCGIPCGYAPVRSAALQFLDCNLTHDRAQDEKWLMRQIDMCHLGFWLRIGSYFGSNETRLLQLAATLLRAQMPDGGWNCRQRTKPNTHHSSFHTTLNVLEGLAAAAESGIITMSALHESEARALEFMCAHQLYRSDRTGQVINPRFTELTYPSYWHYTVLRGLDYVRNKRAIADDRLQDPLDLLQSRCRPNGRWPVEKRIPGGTLFDMETMGADSRWNTLRALRVVRGRQRALATEAKPAPDRT